MDSQLYTDFKDRGYNTFNMLNMKFQLPIKGKMEIQNFLDFKVSGVVSILFINVKMPTLVCILTFINRINFMLSLV